MAQTNDCINVALGAGQINDLLAVYFSKTADESLNDAMCRWLLANGATAGHLNDMWFEYLVGQGYTGTLSDMWNTFWCVDGGAGGGAPVFHAATYDPDTYELTQELIGVGGETTTHTSDILSPDHEGTYHTFGENEPVWEGGRVVENTLQWSNDLSNVIWSAVNGAIYNGLISGVGPNGEDAYEWEFPAASDRLIQSIGLGIELDLIFRMLVRAKPGTGNGDFRFMVSSSNSAGASTGRVFSATEEWGDFTHYMNTLTTEANFVGIRSNAACTLQIIKMQVETATGRSDLITPSEWIETTTVPIQKLLANANGNTVLGDLVNEADGALLDPLPMLKYQMAATNVVTESYMGAGVAVWSNANAIAVVDLGPSQIISAQNKFRHTADTVSDLRSEIMVAALTTGHDAFSMIIEAETSDKVRLYIRDNTAVVTMASYDFSMIDGSVAGILTPGEVMTSEIAPGVFKFTISGDAGVSGNNFRAYFYPNRADAGTSVVVHYAAMMPGMTAQAAHAIGPILTSGTAASTDETVYTWAAANHDNTEGTYSGAIDYDGDDGDVLSLGGVPFLYIEDAPVSGKQLTLTDGTNQVSRPITAGEHTFRAAYNATAAEMYLMTDSVRSENVPYDGTLGTGDITIGETGRDFKRFNESGIV